MSGPGMGEEPAATQEATTPTTEATVATVEAPPVVEEAAVATERAPEATSTGPGPALNLTLFRAGSFGWALVSDETRDRTGSRAVEILPIGLDDDEPLDTPNSWLERLPSGIVARAGG